MKKIFVNQNRQLRSGWKVALVMVLMLASSVFLVGGLGLVWGFIIILQSFRQGTVNYEEVTRLVSEILSGEQFLVASQILSGIGTILSIYFVLRLIDKKRMRNIGFTSIKKGWSDLIWGLAFGAVSIAVVFFILLSTGSIELNGMHGQPNFSLSLISGLVMFIMVGINEELLTRGYCMTAFGQMGKPWLAVLLSSLIFSMLHLANPNVSLVGLLNIILVGVLFSTMTLKRGSIWMPIGYHITWNYFQGYVFGFPVSGTSTNGLYNLQLMREDIFNGGFFGPEGGLVCTMILLASFAVVYMIKGKENSKYINQYK